MIQHTVEVLPRDEYNETLVSHVHPRDWQNPKAADRYNLVVIGAGTAGLITAAGSAGLGARVALIERELLGGDCLNVGCVPSKALIRAARMCSAVRSAAEFGVKLPGPVEIDFPEIMRRMRRLRASISPNDSAGRYRSLGVDVYLGAARFTGPDAIEVSGQTLRFRKAVIATGARAVRPRIEGLSDDALHTNETIFTLTELPRRIAVLGTGPIGCELAQAFARFGAEVTLIGKYATILPKEDPDAAERVQKSMEQDGVRMMHQTDVARVIQEGSRKILVLKGGPQDGEHVEVDAILAGAGRAPNVEGLGLETAGVKYDSRMGVHVSDRLQTSNPRIYAAGDICSAYKFTHSADALARIAIQNALFMGRAKASALTIPWCTYTDPEIAHVGLSEHEAKEKNIPIRTFVQELHHVDRAILDGQTEGFVKIHVAPKGDRILGATIVADHAGDLISEITLAMVGKLGLGTIGRTIHPYPTQGEAIKKVADAFARTRLTPTVRNLLQTWLKWTR